MDTSSPDSGNAYTHEFQESSDSFHIVCTYWKGLYLLLFQK